MIAIRSGNGYNIPKAMRENRKEDGAMLKYFTNVSDVTQPYYKLFCDFHRKDRGHFLRIKNDIFDVCKCTLFYYGEDAPGEADLELDIGEASLYVLIVSSHVLFDPDFDLRGYHLARKRNIPILPILVENGLEEAFNEKFGNLQCISTCLEAVDPTAVPYTEKLRNFLTQTFALSLDIAAVRHAFDTSIFLSYRKKDRQYAQKLLEAIHSDDKLKNIAVWYDEFLIPGEDFNDNIRAELENSALFLLMVTPSILEDGNYIRIVEYPVACALQKSILPVESVPTDPALLQSAYPQIPETVGAADGQQLKQSILAALKRNGITVSERTAQRDLFIGFAFLKGLYVEKNPAIALELIENAARGGVLEAMPMLASIYKYGDGCPVDIAKAVSWQKAYIGQLLVWCGNFPNRYTTKTLVEAYRELADIFIRGYCPADAAGTLMELVRFLEKPCFRDAVFAKEYRAESYESAALLYMSEGNYTRARHEYLEMAVNLRKELCNSQIAPNATVDLIAAWLYLARCQSESDDIPGLKMTVKVELKALAEELLAYTGPSVWRESLQFLQKVLFCLNSLGQYYDQLHMENEAFVFMGAAVNLAEAINRLYQTVNTNILAYQAYKNEGLQHVKIPVDNHLRAAYDAFQNAYEIAKYLLEQSETVETSLMAAESYVNLALVQHRRKQDGATANLEAAFAIYRQISQGLQTVPAKQKLYQSYYTAARIHAQSRRTDAAMEMLDQGISLNHEVVQRSHLGVYKLDLAQALLEKGELLKKQWEFEEALECFRQRHALLVEGAYKNAHILLIAESYENLIAAHKSLGNMQEAAELKAQLAAYKNKYSYVFNGSVSFYS